MTRIYTATAGYVLLYVAETYVMKIMEKQLEGAETIAETDESICEREEV